MLQHLKYLGVGLIIFGTGLALVMSAYLGFVLITDYLTPEYMFSVSMWPVFGVLKIFSKIS